MSRKNPWTLAVIYIRLLCVAEGGVGLVHVCNSVIAFRTQTSQESICFIVAPGLEPRQKWGPDSTQTCYAIILLSTTWHDTWHTKIWFAKSRLTFAKNHKAFLYWQIWLIWCFEFYSFAYCTMNLAQARTLKIKPIFEIKMEEASLL